MKWLVFPNHVAQLAELQICQADLLIALANTKEAYKVLNLGSPEPMPNLDNHSCPKQTTGALDPIQPPVMSTPSPPFAPKGDVHHQHKLKPIKKRKASDMLHREITKRPKLDRLAIGNTYPQRQRNPPELGDPMVIAPTNLHSQFHGMSLSPTIGSPTSNSGSSSAAAAVDPQRVSVSMFPFVLPLLMWPTAVFLPPPTGATPQPSLKQKQHTTSLTFS